MADLSYLDRAFKRKMPEEQSNPNGEQQHPPPPLPSPILLEGDIKEKHQAYQILELSRLLPFPNQPFKMHKEEIMIELVRSVAQNGVITPILVRPKGVNYEIICGHNRVAAAKKAGLFIIPSIIKTLTDDEAILAMVESNLNQRQHILTSERAFAYQMQFEAMKRQGKRTNLTSCQVDTKLEDEETTSGPMVQKLVQNGVTAIITEQSGESYKQIQRYIALTKLKTVFLDKLDENMLPFQVGVNLSFLDEIQQDMVYDFFFSDVVRSIDLKTSEQLKERGRKNLITLEWLNECFAGKAPPPQKRVVNIKLKCKNMKQYIPKSVASDYKTTEDYEKLVYAAIAQYFKEKGFI